LRESDLIGSYQLIPVLISGGSIFVLHKSSIIKLMDKLTNKVLEGEVLPPVAHAVVALQNIKLRSIELERKIKETEELEARLEVLEDGLEQKGGRRWGA
jgi:hypothetical protein